MSGPVRIWRVVVRTGMGRYAGTIAGRRNVIMDMLYDSGALGVTVIEEV